MPSEGPSRPYNWRLKSLAKLKLLISKDEIRLTLFGYTVMLIHLAHLFCQ